MGYVPSLASALTDAAGKVLRPWNSFFQQFTEKAQAADIPIDNPYTPNTQGNLIFSSGTPTITLTRGNLSLNLTGSKVVPVAVGDTVSWSGATVVYFLRTFSK